MSQRNDSGFKTFTADEAIELYSRVKLDSDGKVTKAGLTEKGIGTLQTAAALAAGDEVSVKLRSAAGTHKVRAKEACDAGALLYSEADGEVQDTAQATSFIVGTALEAAAAENDIIEMLYNNAGDTAAS
tara:strand:- start:7407 stop:7793 length:387 start_codon:yes stop_codon:yes gene_type:complete